MLKNKKGFTLIELLVAIAIMISITVVAIISITKVSEGSKKQSYELVKDQVKTAALEYFSANEYWFEGLENGSTGYITVTKLVEEGYLNSLTNPTTGEKLNGCDYVEVKKTDNGYQYNFLTDNSGTCKDNNSLTVMEPNAPEFTLKATCDSNSMNSDDWCNKDVTISLVLSEADKENIISKEYSLSNSTADNANGDFNDDFQFTDEKESRTNAGTTLTATISNGKQAIRSITYKIDKTEPTCAINTSENNIKNTYNRTENVKFVLKTGDALSGVKNEYISTNEINNITSDETYLLLNNINSNSNKFTLYGKVVDNAGNEKLCNTSQIAIVAPNCRTEIVSNDSDGIRNGWYNGQNAPVIELYVNNEYKTSKTATEGDKNYSFTDNYGCGYNPTENVKYDKTGPVLNYINIKNAGLSSTTSWTSQTATFDVETYDEISGINTSGANGGLFWITWNNGSDDTMPNGDVIYSNKKTYSGSVVDLNISNGVYTRINGSLSDNGKRKQYYESCDLAGNCTGKHIYANIDKVIPTVDLIMKKKNNSTTLYPESNISGLSNYSNNEIYNGYVFTKTSYTAGPSGATVTCSDTNYDYILGGTHGPYNNFSTYRNVNREGVTTIRCTATSGSGNTSSEITKTIKLERKLKMVLDEEKMKQVTAKSTGYTKPVFDTTKGSLYYSYTNKMNCTGCSIGAPNSAGHYAYIGTTCKNVQDYYRHFTITTPLGGGWNTYLKEEDGTSWDSGTYIIYEDVSKIVSKKDCNLTSSFNLACGKDAGTSRPNFTVHYYYFKRKSTNAVSNSVILYTKYLNNCGYSY